MVPGQLSVAVIAAASGAGTAPAQLTVTEAGQVITGFCVSFTVTVNEQLAEPQELVPVNDTVVVPILNNVPLPEPEPVPVVAPVNVYDKSALVNATRVGVYVTVAPHIFGVLPVTMLDGQVMDAFAVSVTVAVIGVPEQPFASGVIVNVTVISDPVVLVSAPLISPEPLAAMPVTSAVWSRVQVNVAPDAVLLNAMVVIGPLQVV